MLCVTITIVYCVFSSLDQFLDLRRRDRIERRAGFVHQNYFRFHGERARDAEPLLLATRKACPGLVQIIFHFVPKSRHAQ